MRKPLVAVNGEGPLFVGDGTEWFSRDIQGQKLGLATAQKSPHFGSNATANHVETEEGAFTALFLFDLAAAAIESSATITEQVTHLIEVHRPGSRGRASWSVLAGALVQLGHGARASGGRQSILNPAITRRRSDCFGA